MTLLTIFSTPKPFTDPHISMIQRNAIRSWLALGDEVEVLLMGDERGMAETAAELGVMHLPEAECNEWGTPLISSIFSLARERGKGELLAFVNADILFMPDLVTASRQLQALSEHFVMFSQRWDLDVTDPLDFSPGWDARLKADVDRRGKLHVPSGSDYFVIPRGVFTEIPDFAVGRSGWDNWMIYHALDQGWLTVDATPSVQIIHQNHAYNHLPDGQKPYDLEESVRNRALAGGKTRMYIVIDTPHQLKDGQIVRPPITLERVLRRMELAVTPRQGERRGLRRLVIRRLRRMRKFLNKRLYPV